MLESMEALIRDLAMIPPGSHILCAVSGGADSVCLLHALYRLRDTLQFTLSAAHYDHQLRGEESQRDAFFVKQFVQMCCGQQRLLDGRILPPVQLYMGTGDVAQQAALQHQGIEETAREMRYAFLQQTAREAGADRIATAHTADDNAETLLLHLTRGSGLRGLGGIPPSRDNLIRPLLTTSRSQIEAYLLHYALPHVEDSSNANDDYTRNRLRHQVIPLLEQISPGFLLRMTDTAQLLREDEAYLTHQAGHLSDLAVQSAGQVVIPAALLAEAPRPVAVRAIRLLLGQLWGGDQDCGSVHLLSILDLCRGTSPSAQVDLPHGSLARREYEALVLTVRQPSASPEEAALPLPGKLRYGAYQIQCNAQAYHGQRQGPWQFWLAQSSVSTLSVRSRHTGDTLSLPGRPEKSVKKWMIQERLPRHCRDLLPVFDCGGQVAAVAGLGPDRAMLPQPGQSSWLITISPLP